MKKRQRVIIVAIANAIAEQQVIIVAIANAIAERQVIVVAIANPIAYSKGCTQNPISKDAEG